MRRSAGRPPKVDRQKFHEFLWKKRGRYDYIPFSQGELAAMYDVTQSTMSIVMKEMIEEGRLISKGHRWVVIDPSLHRWEHTPEPHTLF